MQIIPIATCATRLVLIKHAEQALMELRSNLVWEMEKSQQNTQIELCVTYIHHQKLFLKLKFFTTWFWQTTWETTGVHRIDRHLEQLPDRASSPGWSTAV